VRFPDQVPTLTDGVVSLRAHRPGDAAGCWEQCQDPLSQAWTTIPVPYSTEDARTFVEHTVPQGWRDGTDWAFAVETLDDLGLPRYAGTVSLRDRGEARAEVAYGSHAWVRGRGVLQRALNLLLDWGFEQQGVVTVVWWANQGNWASRKLAWRLGFSFGGTVRQWLPQRGQLHDAWVGELLSDDERLPRNPWYDVPRIVSDTLVLRAHEPRDAVRVQEACADPRTMEWFHRLPEPYTLQDAHDYLEGRIEQRATGSGISWAVADPHTNELVANISLFDIKPGREAEIGYWTHPAFRGRGLMTQACRMVVRHAFIPDHDGGLGLAKLLVSAAEPNSASRRVIEANGFTEMGRERWGALVRGGRLVDMVCYDMLAAEFGDG
jgi:RimJ/RimL family protein N-acetyltransferase